MIAQGDACWIPLPDQSVHTVCTSPPYWGLRKYAGEQGEEPLGLEATPERHVERIVEICREVRRVLRDDGVFWLNYGDSYSGSGGPGNQYDNKQGPGYREKFEKYDNPNRSPGPGAGNLTMMPHRVALALQQDGWIVRQDLVWHKRNPMPESVNGWRWQREREKKSSGAVNREGKAGRGSQGFGFDGRVALAEWEYGDDFELKRGSWRHTRAHEYVFMLVKGMQYWSNQEAVRESQSQATIDRFRDGAPRQMGKAYHPDRNEAVKSELLSGRNPRSVLDVPTQPYKGSHYATFPPNLIAPLIRATCPRWACPVCGQGWAAVVERADELTKGESARYDEWDRGKLDDFAAGEQQKAGKAANMRYTGFVPGHFKASSVLGYRPTCEHEHTQEEAVPGIVFDPFVGSGTTVAVAQQLLRRGIGIDISMEYLDQQAKIRAGLGTPSNALDELPLFAQTLNQ